MVGLHFELVEYTKEGNDNRFTLHRLKVPGGWLVKTYGYREDSICFYPDPKYLWLKDREVDEDIRLIRVDLREVPENESCMVRDDWPHAIIGQREAA